MGHGPAGPAIVLPGSAKQLDLCARELYFTHCAKEEVCGTSKPCNCARTITALQMKIADIKTIAMLQTEIENIKAVIPSLRFHWR